jgi:hypothetical protein
MPRPVEISRLAGGTLVDPSSKGLGLSGDPDEWLILIRLSDMPDRAWTLAWGEQVDALHEGLLDDAEWGLEEDERLIWLWATTENAAPVVAELDAMLERANRLCAEIASQVEQRRAENEANGDEIRESAARLQDQLNRREGEY